MWFVYIVRCSNDSFYTWVTTDVTRRIDEHNNSPKWAKYTRMYRPVELIYTSSWPDKSKACREEARIKKLTRIKKEELILNK